MTQIKGVKLYKKYWEDQASFMDKEPWSKDKVLKLKFFQEYEEKLEELQFSEHSIDKNDGELIVRIKAPYNYFDLDDFEGKALDLIGIKKDWLEKIEFDNVYCKSARW